MAQKLYEESNIQAIAQAIRDKNGLTTTYKTSEMAAAISAIPSGGSDPIIEALEITSNGTYTANNCDGYSPITVNVPQEGAPTAEDLVFTKDCTKLFNINRCRWILQKYGNMVTTQGITDCSYMFNSLTQVSEIPFDININDCTNFDQMFYATDLDKLPKIRGTIGWSTSTKFSNFFNNSNRVVDVEDVFTPEMMEGFSKWKNTSEWSYVGHPKIQNLKSLLRFPSWFCKLKMNPASTTLPYNTYTLYNGLAQKCVSLESISNIPVWSATNTTTSNMFGGSAFKETCRLSKLTFETNEDGSPLVAKWSGQTIDLSSYVGWAMYSTSLSGVTNGITQDHMIGDNGHDPSSESYKSNYEELKNNPLWWTNDWTFSRYNHDSAVETINSLPDTSASGTNTIKFKGDAGSKTDGGAINTLTEEEIAVAAAKGWTVTLA